MPSPLPGQSSKRTPNWEILASRLSMPKFTSGDIESVIGVSRKNITDWEKGEIFHRIGREPGRKSKETKWRLFSFYDLWMLSVLKHLRDWGTWLEKLRATHDKGQSTSAWRLEHSLPEFLGQATLYWVYRNPAFLMVGEHFVSLCPAVRSGVRLPNGRHDWKAEFPDDPTKKQFHVIRLLPLMDHVASCLSRPDFKIIFTPLEILEENALKSAVSSDVWERPIQFIIDGKQLQLEDLRGQL
jgi:hypothetical protein